MRTFALLSGPLLLFAAISTVGAQAAPAPAVISDTAARTAVSQPSTQEALEKLQNAAEELSRAVQQAVVRAANDPEMKSSALQIAAGAVSVAQQSLSQQLKTIESVLAAAARQIAAAQAANSPKAVPQGKTPHN